MKGTLENIPAGYTLSLDCGYTWWRTPCGIWSTDGMDYFDAIAACWAHFVGRRAFKP